MPKRSHRRKPSYYQLKENREEFCQKKALALFSQRPHIRKFKHALLNQLKLNFCTTITT